MCKSKMYKPYNDLECKFKDEVFNGFHKFSDGKHEVLPLIFTKSPSSDDDQCATKFNDHTIWVHYWQQTTRVVLLVNPTLFSQMCGSVQLQCSKFAFALIAKLNCCFLNQEFMNVFGCGLSTYVEWTSHLKSQVNNYPALLTKGGMEIYNSTSLNFALNSSSLMSRNFLTFFRLLILTLFVLPIVICTCVCIRARCCSKSTSMVDAIHSIVTIVTNIHPSSSFYLLDLEWKQMKGLNLQ